MSNIQYTKEQIANIAADILELYGEKTYPIKVVALAEAMGLSVYDATFPTAKGIRRLFRAMIERISKKHT